MKLIYAANLRGGGAVQVAATFILSLQERQICDDFEIIISTPVALNLERLGFDTKKANLKIIDCFGLLGIFLNLRINLRKYSTVFCIFGPLYFLGRCNRLIVGFAQPYYLFERPKAETLLERVREILFAGKYRIQYYFFDRADTLIVEHEWVRKKLSQLGLFPKKKIIVAHNGPNDIFMRSRPAAPKISSTIKFGYVGRPYPHKNIHFFGPFSRELLKQFGIKASLVVTLEGDEYQAFVNQIAGFGCQVETVGSLPLDCVPEFIEGVDCLFLPSLMECFSVSPLEGLMCSRVSLCADRQHFSEILGPHAIYIDPSCPVRAAKQFHENIEFCFNADRLDLARKMVIDNYPSKIRTEKILQEIFDA